MCCSADLSHLFPGAMGKLQKKRIVRANKIRHSTSTRRGSACAITALLLLGMPHASLNHFARQGTTRAHLAEAFFFNVFSVLFDADDDATAAAAESLPWTAIDGGAETPLLDSSQRRGQASACG